MIKVWITENNQKSYGLVWNVEECMFIRQNYRIVGNYVGSLSKAPRQVQMHGLPLMLSHEECQLLVSKNAVSLFKFKNPQCLSEDYINKFKLHEEMNFQQQIEASRETRKREILQLSDQIVEGKLKKRRKVKQDEDDDVQVLDGQEEELDIEKFKKSVIDEEISKIVPLERGNEIKQIFQEQPWIIHEPDQMEPVETLPITNEMRYNVFVDMWEKGFYLTDGTNFGGDFLAYPGDPLMFHAKYIVVCCDMSEDEIKSMPEADLVAKSRLAVTVKKTMLFAYIKDEKIKYKAVEWTEKSAK